MSSRTAGRTFVRDINDTSIDANSITSSMSSGVTYLMFVFSIQTTLSSFLSFHASCPCPTSTEYTFTAPFCSMQSVNPPVEAPTSMHTFPSSVTPKLFIAFSSLSPPLLTYFRVFPLTSILAVSSNIVPALSSLLLSTYTIPDIGTGC